MKFLQLFYELFIAFLQASCEFLQPSYKLLLTFLQLSYELITAFLQAFCEFLTTFF